MTLDQTTYCENNVFSLKCCIQNVFYQLKFYLQSELYFFDSCGNFSPQKCFFSLTSLNIFTLVVKKTAAKSLMSK